MNDSKVEFVTLTAQDPRVLANALSVAIKRRHGQVAAWYRANGLCRELEDIEDAQGLEHEPELCQDTVDGAG